MEEHTGEILHTERNWVAIAATILALIALVVGGTALSEAGQAGDVEAMGVTNLDQLHLSGSSGTATPAFRVNQTGAGRIAEFLDGGTAVWSVDDGGGVTSTGAGTFDTLSVTGAGTIGGSFTVNDTSEITGALTVNSVTVTGTLSAEQLTSTDDATVTDALAVGGALTANSATITGSVQYGSNSLYPLGYASDGYQTVYGTSTITGTEVAAHGLTTVTMALCTLGEDPTAGGGDAAMCTVTVAANVVTLKAWQDDFISAATETDVDVHWVVIGQP
jgi:hypothetical protein